MKNEIKEIIDHDYYEVPDEISPIEAIIYDWVEEHYGEAEDASWCIPELAEHIEETLKSGSVYKQNNTVKYRL